MKLEHPQEPLWYVSLETIYQHIYSRIRAGADLKVHLRQGRKKRIGDWEGDTIEGSRKKGFIATFTDLGYRTPREAFLNLPFGLRT